VNDSYFGDNCVAQPFGVTAFEPNRPRSAQGAKQESEAGGDEEGAVPQALIERLAAANPPEAKSFAFSPFAAAPSEDAGSQWRGNYVGSGWAPLRSTYGFKRSAAKYHWGWDIFAPQGGALVAPVWPATMTTTYIPPSHDDHGNLVSNYGNTAIFSFRYKGCNMYLVYGHLDRFKGEDRAISDPQVVGYVGCTGLAPSDAIGCGTRFDDGVSRDTRNDHVHVGLWYPTATDKKACDANYVLPWKIQ
jgi:hypothetical protein